jgi:hypothetical protein
VNKQDLTLIIVHVLAVLLFFFTLVILSAGSIHAQSGSSNAAGGGYPAHTDTSALFLQSIN